MPTKSKQQKNISHKMRSCLLNLMEAIFYERETWINFVLLATIEPYSVTINETIVINWIILRKLFIFWWFIMIALAIGKKERQKWLSRKNLHQNDNIISNEWKKKTIWSKIKWKKHPKNKKLLSFSLFLKSFAEYLNKSFYFIVSHAMNCLICEMQFLICKTDFTGSNSTVIF